jgi:hypothetical protein
VSWQTTTTWRRSNDPAFIAKMQAILALYDHPPEGSQVICVDEFGPLNLQPRTGKAWRPTSNPPGGCGPPTTETTASGTFSAPWIW